MEFRRVLFRSIAEGQAVAAGHQAVLRPAHGGVLRLHREEVIDVGRLARRQVGLLDLDLADVEVDVGQVLVGELGEAVAGIVERSEEHTSELQSLMRISYAVLCLKKKKQTHKYTDRGNTWTRKHVTV